ncbi:MAG: alpha-hydroxy-acid oxidizing protein [Deltaproteobacteria bacterium]|nr:alpha-hydroxy-acid oxidizing protein [Deltaproteobacteria bacterium]
MDFVTNQEIIMAARRNLNENVWHYLTGGAESETTMRRNRFGLDSLAFRPRVLEILQSEIVTTMGLLGITRLDQLTGAYLDTVQLLAPPHEMSAFPQMPGSRLL